MSMPYTLRIGDVFAVCHECQQRVPLPDLAEHLATHLGTPLPPLFVIAYACPSCGAEQESGRLDDEPFTCPLCGWAAP